MQMQVDGDGCENGESDGSGSSSHSVPARDADQQQALAASQLLHACEVNPQVWWMQLGYQLSLTESRCRENPSPENLQLLQRIRQVILQKVQHLFPAFDTSALQRQWDEGLCPPESEAPRPQVLGAAVPRGGHSHPLQGDRSTAGHPSRDRGVAHWEEEEGSEDSWSSEGSSSVLTEDMLVQLTAQSLFLSGLTPRCVCREYIIMWVDHVAGQCNQEILLQQGVLWQETGENAWSHSASTTVEPEDEQVVEEPWEDAASYLQWVQEDQARRLQQAKDRMAATAHLSPKHLSRLCSSADGPDHHHLLQQKASPP